MLKVSCTLRAAPIVSYGFLQSTQAERARQSCAMPRHFQGRVFDEIISSRRGDGTPTDGASGDLRGHILRKALALVLSFHCDFVASPCALGSMRSPFPARTRRRFRTDSCASRWTPSSAAAAPCNLQSPHERASEASAASTDVFLLCYARMVLVSSVKACAMFLRAHLVFKRCSRGIFPPNDTAYRLMSSLFCFSRLVSVHCSAHAGSFLT